MRAIFENAKKLGEALAFVTGVVPKRTPMPILAHVLVEVRDGGTLILMATDLDRMHSVSVKLQDGEPGIAVVPAARLAKLIAELPVNTGVSFKLTDTRLSITCGRGRWWLPTRSSEDFPPPLLVGEDAARFTLSTKTTRILVQRLYYAISTEEIRYYLNGMNLRWQADKLVCASTNGHVLSKHELDIDPGRDLNVIVPLRMIETLKTIAGFGDVYIAVDGERVSFTCGRWQAVSKLIDGTFPDYAPIIPATSDNRIEVKSENLLAAIVRLKAVAEAETTIGLVWNAEEPLLQICLAQAEDNGEELDAVVSGAARVAASPDYLIETIEALDCETVQLDCSSPGYPIRVTAVDGNADSTHLVMPMRWFANNKKDEAA